MRFNKVVIHSFRRFLEDEVHLGNKITAIAGNNGTGKSTVLGILANSSQLSGYKTYLGKAFRGEFSELFSGSPEHDATGQKMELFYSCHGVDDSVEFRTAWQDKKTRFRLIPKKVFADGSITESKLESPVIYLGLSRLYPVGEARRKMLTRRVQKWDSEEDGKWFEEKHRWILGSWEDFKSVSQFGITGLSRKAGTGIETKTYGPAANSSGQDNLGQILLSVLSMKKLKRELGADWDGGLLIVDEIDATLHPAAQLRLLDLLLKESGKVGFQTVFTTHSTVILERLAGITQHNRQDVQNDVEVIYLTDANKKLKIVRNPTWPQMENDLLVRSAPMSDVRVGVFCEDAEARWFASGLLKMRHPQLFCQVDFVDATFGCKELMNLYAHDFAYIKNRIVVFDGDVTENEIKERVPESLMKSGKNIVVLPGNGKSPEKVVFEYLSGLDDESGLLEGLLLYGFTLRVLNDEGPFSQRYSGKATERERFKDWFNDYRAVFELSGVLDAWAADNDEIAWNFVDQFTQAYNEVARRTSAPEVPMAKRPAAE